MKKSRCFIYVIAGAFLSFMVGLFVIRYVMVNKKYPEAICEKYNIGETLEYDGCDVLVKDYVILDKKEASDLGYYLSDDVDYKILKCTMEVTNNSASEKSPELYYVEAESSVWHNGVDLEVLHNVKGATGSLRPTLSPGAMTTVTVVFVMYKLQFSNARWEKIDSDNLCLVFSLYPVKKYVVLQGEFDVNKVSIRASWAYNYEDVQELSENSDLIAVVSISSGETYEDTGVVKTKYQAKVVDEIYGEDSDVIEIVMTGGTLDKTTYEVDDDPLMKVKDEFLIFARKNTNGTYTILSGPQGRFVIENNKVYSLNVSDAQVADANAHSNISVNGMAKEDFVAQIKSYVTSMK